jgi:glucose/arabinose dehydrogenase
MRAQHRVVVFLSGVALVACAKPADQTRDTVSAAGSTPTPAAQPAPTPIALGDLTGKWQMKATPEGGTDTTSTNFVLTATADTTGWTLTFPNRKPVALHIMTGGDSIVANSEPYESVRRKGLQVTTNSVFRVQNGQLSGMTMAHYKSKGADSVLHLRTQGTRMP